MTFAELKAGVREAEDHVAHGRWWPAFDLYGDLFSRRMRDLGFAADELTDTDLLVLERVADIAVPLGETNAADALYAIVCERHIDSNPQRYVHAATKRVLIALAADRFDDAMQLARAFEPSLGALDDVDCTDEGFVAWEARRPWISDDAASTEAQLYLALGRLLAGAGQFADAQSCYRRGLHFATGSRDTLAVQARTPLQLAMAHAAVQRGEMASARSALNALGPEHQRPGDAIRWHELDAAAAVASGDFGHAEQALAGAAAICQANGFTHAFAGVLLVRAKLLIAVNRIAEARAIIDDVLRLATTLRAPRLGLRANRLADFARLRQEALFGDATFADAIARLQSGPDRNHDAAPAPLGADQDVVTWRPADFLAYFEERELEVMAIADVEGPTPRRAQLLELLVADFEHSDSARVRARLQLLQGVFHVQTRKWSVARPFCSAAADAFAALDSPADEYAARRYEALCAEHLPDGDGIVRSLRARAQQLLETLTATMTAESREPYLVNKWSQREAELADTVGRLLEERRSIERKFVFVRWPAWIGWCGNVAALHRALVMDAWARTDIEGVAARLRGLWTLASSARDAHNVAFASLPNSTVHVAVGWFRCTLEAAPVARGRLRELVRRFHKLIASGDRTSDAQADETAAEIGRALGLQPMLQSLPARVRRITIVPDDQLHAFPFAALPIGGGSYVVDRWAITIGVRRSIAAGKASPTATPITVASTSGGAALAPLPEADEQSRWLVEWWTARGCRPTQLQNEACTRARLLDTLGSSRVFHFSGHGSFDPDAPDKTGIVVSGEPNAGTVVNIARLAAVDCRGLRLATFFSCWSADSFLFPGHWAVSVPNTLCRAGARAIVAPLWEIEDRTSTALLRSIYGRLETTRVDEAVRQAQIETRSAGGRRRSPYFWAALQVYGDGARLDRKSFGGAAWPS